MGYTEEDDAAKAPALDGYQPLMSSQAVYMGAEEEEGCTMPRPRGVLDPDGRVFNSSTTQPNLSRCCH
jgi:hypothetical protein